MEYGQSPKMTSWAVWISLAAGIWEMLAPWVWGYSFVPAAVINNMAVGALAIAISLIARDTRLAWPGWWNVVLGAWLIFAPFALGYAFIGTAATNDLAVGIIIGLAGLLTVTFRRTE
ncbi:MAG: SPW repeat domain-containing protein [Armatimonadota bacterium]